MLARLKLMRIRISHATTYRYDAPPTGVIQMLRLTPRNHDGQYVVNWRVDLSEDCLLHQHEDAFGNISHSFTAEGRFANWRSRSKARSIPRHPRAWSPARSSVSARAVPARDRADRTRRRHYRLRRNRARGRGAIRWRCCTV